MEVLEIPQGFIYLAAPYTDADAGVRQRRAVVASAAAGWLAVAKSLSVFSPITHGDAIAGFLAGPIAENHSFWMAQYLPMLKESIAIVVLEIPGFDKSKGVGMEKAFAEKLNIPRMRLIPSQEYAKLLEDWEAEVKASDIYEVLFPAPGPNDFEFIWDETCPVVHARSKELTHAGNSTIN